MQHLLEFLARGLDARAEHQLSHLWSAVPVSGRAVFALRG